MGLKGVSRNEQTYEQRAENADNALEKWHIRLLSLHSFILRIQI